MTRTKKATAILWLALTASGFGHTAAAPMETFRLSYADGDWTRLEISQSAVYKETSRIPTENQVPAQETRQSLNAGFKVGLHRAAKNADGSMTIEATYRGKWRESLREGTAASAADYSRIPGRTLTFRLSADGNVTEIRGFEDFPEILDPATRRPIERSDFAYDIGHLFPRLPDRPVSIGSTWEAPETSDAIRRPGQEPAMFRYQVLARVDLNGIDCLKIVASRTGQRTVERTASGGGMHQVDSEYGRIDVFYFSLRKAMFIAKTISFQNVSKIRQGNLAIGESSTLAMYECAVVLDGAAGGAEIARRRSGESSLLQRRLLQKIQTLS